MFKEWYEDKGKFFVMDVFGGEVITETELGALGINAYTGSQSNAYLLKSIKEKFSVVIDDGSHHSFEQVFTFVNMFANHIESGGVYVIEDLCCCTDPYWWRNDTKSLEDTALGIFKNYLNGGTLRSQNISHEENEMLMPLIDSVHLYNDNIVFIKRK